MKRRKRNSRNFYMPPTKITWYWTEGNVTESIHDDAKWRETRETWDTTSKSRSKISKRLPITPFVSDYRRFSASTFSYEGGTIGASVKVQGPHPYIGNDKAYEVRNLYLPHLEGLWASLISKTQPFRRSEYSIFVQARELLELSMLFSLKAKSFLELAGNSYLNVKFGWLPFLKDIAYVGEIMKDHQKRVKEILHLAEKGWYSRKRVRVHTSSETDQWKRWPTISMPYPAWISCDVTTRAKDSVEGSIRWGLAPGAWRFFEELEAENLIFRTAMEKLVGFEKPSPQDVWNIIPFSWLVDYFVKINDFLGANFDDGLFEVTEGSVTRRIRWVAEITPDSRVAPVGSVGKITLRKTQVTRKIVDDLWRPRIRFSGADLLSAGQWGVLAALLIKFRSAGTGKPIVPS